MGKFKGVNNPRYRGNFYVMYENGMEELVEDITLTKWCRDNAYSFQRMYDLRNGKISRYKNIIAMEYESERS
jgi:hypothetical protein